MTAAQYRAAKAKARAEHWAARTSGGKFLTTGEIMDLNAKRSQRMSRPTCIHCGNPYGRRWTTTETVRWREGDQKPPYRGNGIVLKDRDHGMQLSQSEMAAALPKSRWNDEAIAGAPEHRTYTAYRDIWDGETWVGGYDPFCTLRCALDYARKAYANRQTKLRAVK